MKEVWFCGYSDDLVHYFVNGVEEEINSDNATFGMVSTEGMMVVIVRYGDRGPCWSVTPMMWEEGSEFPDWPIGFDVNGDPINKEPYSMLMRMEVPDDTKVFPLK